MNKFPSFALSFLLIFTMSPRGFAAPQAASVSSQVATYNQLLHAIREIKAASQARITVAVEQEKVREAWETGKLIDEHILLNRERAQYGQRVLKRLSFDLGVSETELGYMVQFARAYPISPTSGKLSWGHYRDLLAVNDPKERSEIESFAAAHELPLSELRKEITRRRRASAEKSPAELPEITPGPLYTYQIIRLKDRLKIDLGFGLYLDLPEKDAKKFKEGDIVHAPPSLRGSKQGEAETISLLKDISPSDLFTYSALATQVVDGDTFHALMDLGFGITMAQRVRLRRIDAPEILTSVGKEAKASLEKILSRDQGRVLLKSTDLDQHGRPIADVWVQGKPVDQELLDQGLAV